MNEDDFDLDEIFMDLDYEPGEPIKAPIMVSRETLESSPRISDAMDAIYRDAIKAGLIKHAEFASLFHKEVTPMTDEEYLKACDALIAAVVEMMEHRDDETLKRLQEALLPPLSSDLIKARGNKGELESWAKTLTKKQIEERRQKRSEAFAYYHPTETPSSYSSAIRTANTSDTNISWNYDLPREKGTA